MQCSLERMNAYDCLEAPPENKQSKAVHLVAFWFALSREVFHRRPVWRISSCSSLSLRLARILLYRMTKTSYSNDNNRDSNVATSCDNETDYSIVHPGSPWSETTATISSALSTPSIFPTEFTESSLSPERLAHALTLVPVDCNDLAIRDRSQYRGTSGRESASWRVGSSSRRRLPLMLATAV